MQTSKASATHPQNAHKTDIYIITHKRSQDFLWGELFSSTKLTTFFSRRPSKYKPKLLNNHSHAPNLPRPAKIGLCLPEGALSTFPCKLGPKFFLHRGCARAHLVQPLTTPLSLLTSKLFGFSFKSNQNKFNKQRRTCWY